MSPKRLLQYFNEIAEAPDAVPRLWRFILDLAVRGRLVEQDPKDEPAAILMKRVEKEKKGSINRSKGATIAMQPIRIDEMPFDLPYGWLWLRFGAIHDLVRGVTYSKNDVSEEPTSEHLPILRANNIGPALNFEDLVFVRKECIGPYQFLRQGDYMIALSSGSKNLVGKAAYAEEDFKGGFGGFCGVIRLSSPLLRPYTGIFLSSHLYRDALSEGSRGIGINNLKKETLSKVLFPLPPLAEQHRIVAKVDELMALCDELEAAQQKRERRRDRLVVAALNGLNNGDTIPAIGTHSTFKESARFYFNHLPRLTTRPEHIHQLRQTILNLAVRGKLVPQDPNDEPASDLLKRIEAEKRWLMEERKAREQKPKPELEANEMPFAIPNSWAWARLGDVIHLVSGQHLQPGEYSDQKQSGPPYITGPADFGVNGLMITRYAIVRKAVATKGQILLTVKGAGVGKTAVCNLEEVAISRQLMAMTAIKWSQSFLLLTAHRLAESLKESARSLIPGISREDVDRFVFPLPPLAEQHRIVAKVDKLMTLCDELESRLNSTTVTRRQLLEATLKEGLSP